ncbi:DUF58 domain-containing protein [Thiorhodococcus fuscus]|uniref:DUF58 domain-containing protein n=1 Tax=Thiorhodococcus fuscus TaxID=527200 RepID=A0ABW4Y5H8_9GAMM
MSPRNRIRRVFEGLLRRVPSGPDGVARVRARQIYILPTATGMLFGAVLMLMLIGSLNYQNNLGLLFTFFLASVGIVAMHHAWFNLLGLAIQVRGGTAVFAGETAQFEVALRSERPRPRYDIRVLKDGQGPDPHYVPPGDQRSVHLGIATERRGPLRLVDLKVETHHPMGLFRAWCLIASDASTLVYPKPATQAPPPASDAGDDRRPHRHRGEGAEDYQGSRGYRPGDSPRHIDWKAFARERGLTVKVFGGDQGQELWLDWSHLDAPDPEVRLSLLARQVLDASTARIRFGLRLPGAVEGLDQGAAHTQRCLTRLALFGYEGA